MDQPSIRDFYCTREVPKRSLKGILNVIGNTFIPPMLSVFRFPSKRVVEDEVADYFDLDQQFPARF